MDNYISSGWMMHSSVNLGFFGEKISKVDFKCDNWLPVTIPGTVVSGLIENNLYPDPYFDFNMAEIPGYKPQKDHVTSNLPMPDNSPFRNSYWFRSLFKVAELPKNKRLRIKFHGINYAANIWINGKRVAGQDHVNGMFSTYEIDVTHWISENCDNCLAVEVFAQKPDDLGHSFIDWCPVPPDDSMGICQPVSYRVTGQLYIEELIVKGAPKLPTLDAADISLLVKVGNCCSLPLSGNIRVKFDGKEFDYPVSVAPFSVVPIKLTSQTIKHFLIKKPRIWWPHDMGKPELYELEVEILNTSEKNSPSDSRKISFGIRDISSRITKDGVRLFSVNGVDILVRGGAWTPDLMLRHSKERVLQDIRYLKNLNFNALRIEGVLTPDDLWEECDREGVLILSGLPASSHWERWDEWKAGDLDIAVKCLRSELSRIVNHPSLAAFMYGSDFPPPENIEREYKKVLDEYIPELTHIASASAHSSKMQEISGVKMTGPYSFVPPVYWYSPSMKGYAFGFNTEAGPDISIPQIESLRKMLKSENLIPDSPVWNHHAGLVFFADTKPTNQAIEMRYGKPDDIVDFAKTAQVLAYECWRSLYEAHNRNFPSATGIIAWKMNSPWPRLIWQLYDYFLNPTGGFYGVKKACEPLHVQYSYDDHSIWVINSADTEKAIFVSAELYDSELNKLFVNSKKTAVSSRDKISPFAIPFKQEAGKISINGDGKSPLYFLVLSLLDGNKQVSRNFYCLSSNPDIPGAEDPKFFAVRPMIQYGDYKALRLMSEVKLSVEKKIVQQNEVEITLANTSGKLAFFIWIKLFDKINNDFIHPVLWSDNCVSLLPGEKITVRGKFDNTKISAEPKAVIEGWNVKLTEI